MFMHVAVTILVTVIDVVIFFFLQPGCEKFEMTQNILAEGTCLHCAIVDANVQS